MISQLGIVFRLYMWIAVLLVLLITGTIFYGLAKNHMNLQMYKVQKALKSGSKPVIDDYGLYKYLLIKV